MDLTYVVDSWWTRCALPKQLYAPTSRMTMLTSSNGSSNAPIHWCEHMPRLQDGEAAAETREIIGIDGPPCLSLGMQVETSPSPAGFWYGKQFQAYIWGEYAKKIDRIVAEAHSAGQTTHTPAQNYVPYCRPNADEEENLGVSCFAGCQIGGASTTGTSL